MEITRILELVRKGKLETHEAEKLIQSICEEDVKLQTSKKFNEELSGLNERIFTLEQSFGEFRKDLNNSAGLKSDDIESRINNLYDSIEKVEPVLKEMSDRAEEIESMTDELTDRTDDIEIMADELSDKIEQMNEEISEIVGSWGENIALTIAEMLIEGNGKLNKKICRTSFPT